MGAKNRRTIDAILSAAKTMGWGKAQQAMQEALAQGYITAEEAAVVTEEVVSW